MSIPHSFITTSFAASFINSYTHCNLFLHASSIFDPPTHPPTHSHTRFLLRVMTKPPAKDRGGRLPLHWAAFRGHLSVVNVLLDSLPSPMERWRAVATKDKSGCTPVHAAAASGAYEVVKTLCEHNDAASAMKDGSGKLPLHYAASKGHLEVRCCTHGHCTC